MPSIKENIIVFTAFLLVSSLREMILRSRHNDEVAIYVINSFLKECLSMIKSCFIHLTNILWIFSLRMNP